MWMNFVLFCHCRVFTYIYSFQGVLQAYLHDKMDLQLTAIYALQVHCHNTGFPKGRYPSLFPDS